MRTISSITATAAVFAFAGLAGMSPALGQCQDYGISVGAAPAYSVPGSDIGNHCDDCVTSVAFPFPVSFYGHVYTQANISSDGVIQFGGDSNEYSNVCLPTTDIPGPAIFAFWDDIDTEGAADHGIFVSVSGSAPSRVFQIEWRTAYHSDNTLHANFAVQFPENDPSIRMIYGTIDRPTSATIGVQASSSGPAKQFLCNGPAALTGTMLNFSCAAPRITYQGKLTELGVPANGSYDMVFGFFRDKVGGSPLGWQAVPGVTVTTGLFTVQLDVPNLEFTADTLFAEIFVNGNMLTPRQEITFAPKSAFAIKAGDATRAETAEFAALATRAQGLAAPDGSPMDAAYVLNDGSVVIPGTLSVGELILPPQTRYAVLPPSAFRPAASSMNAQYTSTAELYSAAENSQATFMAPLVLPRNSTITRIEFLGFDSQADDMAVRLDRVPFDSATPEILASVSSFGQIAGFRTFSSGSLSIATDDYNYSYVLVAHWHVPPATMNGLRLSNVRVTYVIGETPR